MTVIDDALRIYPVIWAEGEPILAVEMAKKALADMLQRNNIAAKVSVWTAATGTQVGGNIFGSEPPALPQAVEKDLIKALISAQALVVVADGLKFTPPILQAAMAPVQGDGRVVFVSSSEPPPDFLRDYLKRVTIDYSEESLLKDSQATCKANERNFSEEFVPPLNGLRPFMASSILSESLALCEDEESAKHFLYRARRDAIELDTDGVIKMVESQTNFSHLKGQGRAKSLLTALGRSMKEGRPVRGVILLGVQGTGKTQLAKATAGELGLPLYIADLAAGFSKWVGDTEEKFRRAIKTLMAVPPGIVLIDELEKVLSAVGNTGGTDSVGKRSGQYILRYMDDPKAGGGGNHLILATSNDITSLPPEYTRAGRWDALLWFGIPSKEVLAQVLEMYIGEYKLSKTFGRGVDISDMTPSEIESTCRMAATLRTNVWDEAVQYTPRLMKFRKEDVEAMNEWRKGRTVDAEGDEEKNTDTKVATLIAGTKRGKMR